MRSFLAVGLLFAVVILSNSLFTVKEYEAAFVLRFGKVNRTSDGVSTVHQPGLHFKWPFIERVVRIDSRIQTIDGRPGPVLTSEKKNLIVDTYVKWRVVDFAQFYLRTAGIFAQAESRLEPLVNEQLRTLLGQRTVQEALSEDREEIMRLLRENTNKVTPEYGIEIVDVRLKKINFPDEVSQSVYNRMRAERTRVATEFRSNGSKEANIIRAKADRNVTVIQANAAREAARIRGEGDAKAAAIYAQTYNKNPEFYGFLRTLDAYEDSFSEQDMMIASPEADFLNLLKKEPTVK